MLARLIKAFFFLLVLAGAAVVGGYYKLQSWGDERIALTTERIIDYPAGTPLIRLAQTLEEQGVVEHAGMFYGWVKLFSSYQKFQAGKYQFSGSVAPIDVAAKVMKGETFNPIVLTLTIPEGFPLKQVVARLAANKIGTETEIQKLAGDEGFAQSLNVPSKNLEGYLYPATYNFTKVPTVTGALKEMVRTFWEKLPKDYEKKVNAMGLTLHEAVTFASLIELETMTDDEKSLISEVIWRRLKDKAPLGIDAAIIYGIKDYDGDLKWSHLSDGANPYNTRIHKGLPPTPIGSPGASSLAAVLTPTDKGYYYYVLMPGSTRHYFSKTLKEHNQNVKKLVNASKRDKKPDGSK